MGVQVTNMIHFVCLMLLSGIITALLSTVMIAVVLRIAGIRLTTRGTPSSEERLRVCSSPVESACQRGTEKASSSTDFQSAE